MPRNNIVSDDEIMDREKVLMENWNLVELAGVTKDYMTTMEWLARRRLVSNRSVCAECRNNRSINKVRGDRYIWCCGICKRKVSLLAESFFSRSKLHLTKQLALIHCWAHNFTQRQTMLETKINSQQTIVDWCNFSREVCDRYVQIHFQEIGGHSEVSDAKTWPMTVEIGEVRFVPSSHSRGDQRAAQWVFGGVERGTGRCFAVPIEDNSATSLELLVLEHILPGTHIISDKRFAYSNLTSINNGVYTHDTVDHSMAFLNAEDSELHIQTLVALWSQAKKKIRRQDWTSKELFPIYLSEFVWRRNFRNVNLLSAFIVSIWDSYPI